MSINLTNHPAKADGSGLYRTVFVVEVLSNEPREDWDLAEIAHDIASGDSSGRHEVLDAREIGKPDMAEALQEQGSDPCFLLGDTGWVYSLRPGDEVMWTDPGNDERSITIRIQTIEFHGDDVVVITDSDGGRLEAHAHELS